MRSSLHVLIRTGQIHFTQQNSVSNFGPVTSDHPAQCYNIKMSFKLRQKINQSHPNNFASSNLTGVLCRTSVLPSQLIAQREKPQAPCLMPPPRDLFTLTNANTACCKTCQHSGLLAPSDFCFLASGKASGIETATQVLIKALDASWSKLGCCDTN